MVASVYHDDAFDQDATYQRLYPRIAGYFAGTYHPSQSLSQRTLFVAEEDAQIIRLLLVTTTTLLTDTGVLLIPQAFHRVG